MAITDLDRPLEEIIKQKKAKPRNNRSALADSRRDGRVSNGGGQRSNKNGSNSVGSGNNSKKYNRAHLQGNNRNRAHDSSRLGNTKSDINQRLGKVDKNARSYRGVIKTERLSTQRSAADVNRRLGSGLIVKSSRPNVSTPAKIDPAQLVITKSISPSRTTTTSNRPEDIIIKTEIPRSNTTKKRRVSDEKPAPVHNDPVDIPAEFPPQPEPTESALPKRNIVLICNLDPRASAEDVGEACSMFGPILSCDMLLDPMGRPLNEAEIEFVYESSARKCVEQLDKNIADGRVLHVKLQDHATLPAKPRYSSRTVIASARVQPDIVHAASSVPAQNGMAGQLMYAPQTASLPPPTTYQQQQYYQQFRGRY